MRKLQLRIISIIFISTTITSCSEENVGVGADSEEKNASTSLQINTSLQNGANLSFFPYTGGVTNVKPEEGLGSWFSMEIVPGNPTIIPLNSLNGLTIGGIQLANTTASLDGNIDNPWMLLGNIGAHQTVNNLNLLSSTSNSATIDFSGWSITWNNIPNIDMSTGASGGAIDGIATLTCNKDCGNGDTYVLNYSATTPTSDPTGYNNVKYALHLEGIIKQ